MILNPDLNPDMNPNMNMNSDETFMTYLGLQISVGIGK